MSELRDCSRRRCLAGIGAALATLGWARSAGAQGTPETPDQIHRYGVDPPTVTLVTRTGHYPFLIAIVNSAGPRAPARRRIEPDEGIFYVEDEVQRLAVSAQGVPFPTDLLFATADGGIVEVHAGIMANDARAVTASVPVKAALQVLAGTVARTSAAPGDYLLQPVFGRTL